jgi:hypothetical protein
MGKECIKSVLLSGRMGGFIRSNPLRSKKDASRQYDAGRLRPRSHLDYGQCCSSSLVWLRASKDILQQEPNCTYILIGKGHHRRHLDQQPLPGGFPSVINSEHRRHLHQQLLAWQSRRLHSDCSAGRLARQKEDALGWSFDFRYWWNLASRSLLVSDANARPSS